jgi:hypothetical protein
VAAKDGAKFHPELASAFGGEGGYWERLGFLGLADREERPEKKPPRQDKPFPG